MFVSQIPPLGSPAPVRLWRTASATATGVAHHRAERSSQDRCAVLHEGDVVALVVSDGASTSPQSAQGASVAVGAATSSIRAAAVAGLKDARDAAIAAVEVARSAVDALAESAMRPGSDFSCTLVVAVLDGRGAAVAQIGDGGVVYRDASGWHDASLARSVADGRPMFLSEGDATVVVVDLPEDLLGVAVITDGLEAAVLSALDSRHAVLDRVDEAMGHTGLPGRDATACGALAALVADLQTSDEDGDDMSLAVARRT